MNELDAVNKQYDYYIGGQEGIPLAFKEKGEEPVINDAKGAIASLFELINPKADTSTFLERLQKEETELDERMSKLGDFMETDRFGTLDAVQKSLLQVQLLAMGTYNRVLQERLLWLSTPTKVA